MSFFVYKNLVGPQMISIDVTANCNLKCLHCYNSSGSCNGKSDMTDEKLLDVIDQVIDMNPVIVCLCGGEPTLRREIVLHSISKMVNSGKVGVVNMVSNGFHIDSSFAQKIKDCGLSMMQISIDGHDELSHDNFRQIKGAYSRAISAIDNCVKAGLQTSVSTIPNILNYRNINKIVEKCFHLGVNSHRSMPFIPIGRGEFANKWILSANQYASFLGEYFSLKTEYEKKGMQVMWGDPMDHLKRMPNNTKLGIYSHQLSIKANGEVVASPYFDFVVGDLNRTTLRDIWDKDYNKIWENPRWLSYINQVNCIDDFSKLDRVVL